MSMSAVRVTRGSSYPSDARPVVPVLISVQGPLQLSVGGRDLDLGPVRQQAVLAVLLFNADRIVTPTTILDGVWGDEAPPSGRKVIPPYVYRLRRILAGAADARSAPAIETLRHGYRLRTGPALLDIDTFDVDFQRAVAAEADGNLGLAARILAGTEQTWYGEPLGGLPGPFAAAQRLQLAERRMAVTERRLEIDLRLGHYEAALPKLVALRAGYPLRERLAVLLMVALYQAGRQAEALDVFQEVRNGLATQLGVGPTPELVDTYTGILRADAASAPSAEPYFPARANRQAV
jgi:DNA-binding SARP family transcriptional activator